MGDGGGGGAIIAAAEATIAFAHIDRTKPVMVPSYFASPLYSSIYRE